jgi:hypothetical protein
MDSFADDDDFAADAPPAPTGHRRNRRIGGLWVALSVVVVVVAVVVAFTAFSSSPDSATAPAAVPTRPVQGSCGPAVLPSPSSASGSRVFTCVLFAEETVAFNSGNPSVRSTADGGDVAFRPAVDLVYYYQHGTAPSIAADACTSRDQPFDVVNLVDLEPGFLACRIEPFGAVSFVEVADASQITAVTAQLSLRITFVPAPPGLASPDPTPAPPSAAP